MTERDINTGKLNRIIEKTAQCKPLDRIIREGMRSYVSQDTVVQTHSGFTSETIKAMEKGCTPLEALVYTQNLRKGRTLTEGEITTLYVNTFMGGVIELAARKAMENPLLSKRLDSTIKQIAQKVYDIADWNDEEDDYRGEEFPQQTDPYTGGELLRTVNVLEADGLLTHEDAEAERNRIKQAIENFRENQE